MPMYEGFLEAIFMDKARHNKAATHVQGIDPKTLVPRVKVRVNEVLSRSSNRILCKVWLENLSGTIAHVPNYYTDRALRKYKVDLDNQ